MASKTYCDICSIEFSGSILDDFGKKIYVGGLGGGHKDYCIECWRDKKNWEKIHEVVLKKTSRKKR